MSRPPRGQPLTITSLAPGGAGVAHVEASGERRAVFVHGVTTGDVVRAEVDLTRRPARGRLLEVLTAGPDRVPAACAWASRCGGCDWMHVAPAAQLREHGQHVRAALPEAFRDVALAAHPADQVLGYRARARVLVRCERGRVEVGIREAGTHEPVPVDTCAVLAPEVESARRLLAGLFAGSRGSGDVQIALGSGGRPVLDVRWQGSVADACFGRLEASVNARQLAGARVTVGEALRPATVGDPTPWMRGADGQPLRLAPGGFAQANESSNARLAQHVAALAAGFAAPSASAGPTPSGPTSASRAVELHAGAGNLSVLLARALPDLVTVESNRESCDAARANLAARGLSARVVEGDADTYAWAPSTRLLVLDPPRAGAKAVAERLAASRVARVIYVSCDPQTLGRDLGLLAATYRVTSVAIFEMFPQTSHVETVVALERVRGVAPARGAGKDGRDESA